MGKRKAPKAGVPAAELEAGPSKRTGQSANPQSERPSKKAKKLQAEVKAAQAESSSSDDSDGALPARSGACLLHRTTLPVAHPMQHAPARTRLSSCNVPVFTSTHQNGCMVWVKDMSGSGSVSCVYTSKGCGAS